MFGFQDWDGKDWEVEVFANTQQGGRLSVAQNTYVCLDQDIEPGFDLRADWNYNITTYMQNHEPTHNDPGGAHRCSGEDYDLPFTD